MFQMDTRNGSCALFCGETSTQKGRKQWGKSRIFQAKCPSFGKGHGLFVLLQALSHITSWWVSTEALVSQSLCVFLPGAPLKPNKTYLPLLSLLVDVCRVISFLQVSASCICNDSLTKKSTKLEATEKLSQEGSKGFPLLLKVCYIISSAVIEIFTCWLLFNWFNMWLQGG